MTTMNSRPISNGITVIGLTVSKSLKSWKQSRKKSEEFVHGDCSDCVYMAPVVVDDEVWGKCRRFPPTIYIDDEGDRCQGFPDADTRCGEYKKAD